jgi:uncharacterized membrane protein
MEAPIHAANDVDKNENVPRIIAICAGIAIAVVATVAMVYSGFWSPPATSTPAKIATTAQHSS